MRRAGFAVFLLCVAAGVASAQAQATPREKSQEDKDAATAAVAGGSLACLGVSIAGGLLLYLGPLAIALLRGHPNTASIAVVNIFLGWSLIGWVVALAWAFSATEAKRYRSG